MLMIDSKVPSVVTAPQFSLHARCDRCKFQAYVVAQKGETELLFCAHHGKEYWNALEAQGFALFDFTKHLDESIDIPPPT